MVQWLRLPASGIAGSSPALACKVSKIHNIYFPLTRKDSILFGAHVTERERALPQTVSARISNSVFGGRCHLIHLTISRRLSGPGLVYNMCTKVAQNPNLFIWTLTMHNDQSRNSSQSSRLHIFIESGEAQ